MRAKNGTRRGAPSFFLLLLGSMGPIWDSEAASSTTIFVDEDRQVIDRSVKQSKCPGLLDSPVEIMGTFIENGDAKEASREYAVEQLGHVALENGSYDLAEYFSQYATQAKVDPKSSFLVSALLLERSRLRVAQIEDKKDRVAELDRLLDESFEGSSIRLVRRWAADQLCSSGIAKSLPRIREVFREYSRSDAQVWGDLCEEKIRFIRNNSSRLEALTAALKVSPGKYAEFIHKWAIDELAEIPGPQPERVLLDIAQGKIVLENQDTQRIRSLRHLGRRDWNFSRLDELKIDQRLLVRAGFYPDWAAPGASGDPCAQP